MRCHRRFNRYLPLDLVRVESSSVSGGNGDGANRLYLPMRQTIHVRLRRTSQFTIANIVVPDFYGRFAACTASCASIKHTTVYMIVYVCSNLFWLWAQCSLALVNAAIKTYFKIAGKLHTNTHSHTFCNLIAFGRKNETMRHKTRTKQQRTSKMAVKWRRVDWANTKSGNFDLNFDSIHFVCVFVFVWIMFRRSEQSAQTKTETKEKKLKRKTETKHLCCAQHVYLYLLFTA